MENGRGGQGVNPDALQEALRAFGGAVPTGSAEIAALVQRAGLTATGSVPAVGNAPDAAARGAQFVIMALAGTELALGANYVAGIERVTDITPVPNTVAWVLGVANLRGTITSVVDLRRFLGLQPEAINPRSRIVVASAREMVIGFLVDGASEFLPIPEGARVRDNVRQYAPPWLGAYAGAMAQINGRTLFLLDAERLLFADSLQRYQADF
jgi:purine-binding chemotaxis protein CheW